VIDAGVLLADTKALVRVLVDDIRAHAAVDPVGGAVLEEQYTAAKNAGRTALAKAAWADGLYSQVAVAWVLGCVFVRFCEDNGLVPEPLIAGTIEQNRLALARDQRSAYVQANPADDDRHWLRSVFRRYASLPATGQVFGAHNPVWLGLTPSADGARQLLQAFQAVDPVTGSIRHDFTDAAWDTRFLGDLYQDLSEHAKKTYALLQTPVFVEEFILDRTLTPAIKTFGLRDTTLIDPTCGSGHFLLGAFHRLLAAWEEQEPGTNRWELIRRSLDAIAGIDINPFAANIARFRLLVAALRAAGRTQLADVQEYPIHIAVGDSLLHGGLINDLDALDPARHAYAYEDVEEVRELLGRSWTAVVGNPPYIVVKDPALNALYRRRFETCRGKYSLGVPFTEQFWRLAYAGEPERAGFVGMITANSFMKREMGKDLIEKWVPGHDVTHVIDTSGAYIPGHGTPTVILFGRGRRPAEPVVRAVMGIRGEPSRPTDPEHGLVWTSITELVDNPGEQSDYVSVVDLERSRLHKHPWSIGGGGAAELKELLDQTRARPLHAAVLLVGVFGMTNADDALLAERCVHLRFGGDPSLIRQLAVGEAVRDWTLADTEWVFFPYEGQELRSIDSDPGWLRRLWPYRTTMWARATFSKATYRQEGRSWWEWHQVTLERLRTPLSITLAFKATHNHFVLDRGGKVFKQTAPVIKLPEGADERAHLELLGILNSSLAAFWLKQICQNVGSTVDSRGARQTTVAFENFFEFDGTKLQQFPLPAVLDATTATLLDRLASELATNSPAAVAASGTPTAERLAVAKANSERLRAEMIGAQEQLDWEAYAAYGLTAEPLTLPAGEPPLALGERAFEIVLARKVAAGEEETSWFARHRSTPITELPSHWSPDYTELVERRIELIDADLNIGLIEKPEHKRRWASKAWDEQVAASLREWLLDRLESPQYWATPQLTSCARLAGEARSDAEFVAVAQLYKGRDDVDLSALVAELVKSEAVPYLAELRFKESGLRKYEQWLAVWELQRREDAGESVGEIPVPPKYTSADFRPGVWEHRGRLDVPKERFVSYPGASREADPSLVVGWAGWNHLERARALATYYVRSKTEGRDAEFLAPLLAGLTELVPWLKQWYDAPNPDPTLDRAGTQIESLVESERRSPS
jgi:hypothetical protein